jgi:cytochrome P450
VAAKLVAKNKDGSDALDDQKKHDQLMNFMFAGHETTANTMSWCMAELCSHADVQAKLQEEIDQMWTAKAGKDAKDAKDDKNTEAEGRGASDSGAWLEDLSYRDTQIKYLTTVLNETLRLHNVTVSVPFRQLEHDEQIKGPNGTTVNLEAGTLIHVPAYLQHR